MDWIEIKGAREHNLKNIDIRIPRNKMVVITGLSGSGKSSLAFDTVYAEGQRRYVESLSAYARQFLAQNHKPDVDSIEGLSPAISIEQKSTGHNPRSTVGTLTEIYDYLRLLYARIGARHCYQCGQPIAAQTVQNIVDHMMAHPEGTKCMVLAPMVRSRKGEYKKEFSTWKKEGFSRVRVNEEMYELSEDEIVLDKQKKHTIDIVIDRLVIKPSVRQRLTDSVELALKKTQGLVSVVVVGGVEKLFSQHSACIDCGISYPEIEPRLFSFNSPHGACGVCSGLGYALEVDLEKVIPDPEKSLKEGVIAPWANRFGAFYLQQLVCVAKHYKKNIDTPWNKLGVAFQRTVLYGSGSTEIAFVYEREGDSYRYKKPFEGVVPSLNRKVSTSESESVVSNIEEYMSKKQCHACQGARLNKEALSITVGQKNIYDVCSMPVHEAIRFFNALEWSRQDREVAARILKEVQERLCFLQSVGLDYLSLDRNSTTLSGGESQRIRLATQIGSALQGVIYVLDEPSIGLHQKDNERLLGTLLRLRDLGNTVLVVEHDEDTMRMADHLIDMGPGAGREGGYVVVADTPAKVCAHPDSITGAYLSGKRGIPVPTKRRVGNGKTLVLEGASGNNLKNVTMNVPLGTFVCVTGVSGSGKSTLVNDTLYAVLCKKLMGEHAVAAPYKKIKGIDAVDKVVDIDQSPIGRTPRSNPATYTQVFSAIRDLFAELPESRARGYAPGRYSFNVAGGRCEMCEGDGTLKIEMFFLADVYVTCEHCQGKRYNRETLEIKYKEKNIADVLAMTVDEAAEFLKAVPPVVRKLETLQAVGLGYISLGQSATTLSGGEAQRIKLSKELSRKSTGKTLYILDEPTTGLHFYDVEKLLHVLHTLVDAGNTVVVIEHHLDVIKTADHIIDLGPDGGDKGGEIVFEGTPEALVKHPSSYTGLFLKPLLRNRV